jgi:hypothetical protein
LRQIKDPRANPLDGSTSGGRSMSVLERIEQRIENMSTMLTRFGIDTAEFARFDNGSVFTHSIRACLSCDNAAICTAWLAQADGEFRHVPEFCPNGRRFAQTKGLLGVERKPQ